MSFDSLDKAIGYALLGTDPAKPVLGATDLGGIGRGFKTAAFDGVRGSIARSQTKIGSRHISFNGVKTEIPVYRFATRGRRIVETWPSLSFELINFQFAPQRYIWRADRFRDPVPSSFIEYKDKSWEGKKTTVELTKEGPTLLKVRDNPEPFDVMFEIRVWSKDQVESYALNRVLLETFPARGALKAVQESGTIKVWEMALQSVACLDDDEPTLEDSEKAAFCWVYTYTVETFLDNTEVVTLKRTITQPELTVEPL